MARSRAGSLRRICWVVRVRVGRMARQSVATRRSEQAAREVRSRAGRNPSNKPSGSATISQRPGSQEVHGFLRRQLFGKRTVLVRVPSGRIAVEPICRVRASRVSQCSQFFRNAPTSSGAEWDPLPETCAWPFPLARPVFREGGVLSSAQPGAGRWPRSPGQAGVAAACSQQLRSTNGITLRSGVTLAVYY